LLKSEKRTIPASEAMPTSSIKISCFFDMASGSQLLNGGSGDQRIEVADTA
jgi:hypothetical protein